MSLKFFMRFYKQPKEQVAAHMQEYQCIFPQVLKSEINPLTASVNMVVPENSWEVDVFFAKKADLIAVKNDKAGIAWYRERAYLEPGAEFVMREPGQKAFSVEEVK